MEQEKSCYFRCDYIHDLSVQKEFSRGAVLCNAINRYANAAVILILALYYPLMIFLLVAPGEYCRAVLTLAFFYLFFELLRLFLSRGGGIQYKRMVFTHGGEAPRCSVRFLEDSIMLLSSAGTTENTFQYGQIRCVCETENLFLLGLKYRLYLIVDKRTLSGSCDDFTAFLLPRCVSMRKRKIINIRRSRLLIRIKWAIIALSVLLAVLHHPALQLKERLSGQLHNGMSCSEIAGELEAFGITGIGCGMLDTYDSIYRVTFFAEGSKLKMLLRMIGQGEYDIETRQWASPTGGVCFFSYSTIDTEGMYTDLLTGISAMTAGELSITEIQESPPDSRGIIRTEFLLNGQKHTLEAYYFAEWYDESVLNSLNALLAGTGKQLYFAGNDDYSCFIFYADADWAQRFTARTGLKLATDIYEIY